MLNKILITFIMLISIILIFGFYYKKEIKEQKIYHIMDQVTLTLNAQLDTRQMDDLKMALTFSLNEGLINALENDDEDLGYQLLSNITNSINKNTNTLIRAQVITKELNVFARSWDDVYAGVPIGDFRTDLKYFDTHKSPRTSLEVGRRLGNKATVPIYKDGIFLGFVEVISFFKSMTNFFSAMGIDLYVLLDIESSDSAVLMRDNLTIENYIVSNRNYNYNHIQTLKSLDFKSLRQNGVLRKDGKYIFYENMHDGNSKIIGAFVFVLPQKYLEYFRSPQDNISFLMNVTRNSLYNIVKEKKYDGQYDNYEVNSLVYLQDVIEQEDRQIFFDEVYDKFDKYSKDELIQMMLNRRIIKKIDGKIK